MRSVSPFALFATGALVLAASGADARTFTWTFDLTGGKATQRFDSVGAVYDWFFTPYAQNLDLQGEVRIDTLSILSPGRMSSANGGYFDVDVVFLPSRTSNQLAGQRINQVSILPLPAAGARWSYVIRSETAGPQSFDASWNFNTETGTAAPFLHLTKFSKGGPFTTYGGGVTGGLRAQVRVWSAAAPTDVTVNSFKVTATGTIVRYQILPSPNDQLIDVEPGDDAFNELQFFNDATLRVRDRLTNRGPIYNRGSVEIAESQDRTELLNRAEVFNEQFGTVANRGRFVNESGATLVNRGRFDNFSSLPGDLLPEGPQEPTSRDPGFFNYGTVQLLGGTFTNNQGRLINQGTFEAGLDGRFVNTGEMLNGTAGGGAGTFNSRGTVVNDAGSFTNYGRLETNGTFSNHATLENFNLLLVAADSFESKLVNHGTLRNRPNLDVGVLDRPSAIVRVDGTLENQGLLDNRGTLEVNGELRNSGEVRNQGQFAFDPEVRVRVTGLVSNTGSFSNSGFMEVAGGRFENSGTFTNEGAFKAIDGGTLIGGVVNNGGQLRIGANGSMTEMTLYRQVGAQALTQVNGPLQADTVQIEGGTLQGADRVQAGVIEIGAGATLAPGNSPGVLTLSGFVTLDGLLDLEIGPGTVDRLIVEGTLTFGPDARVRYSFVDGFLPQAGSRYSFSDFVAADGIEGLQGVTFLVAGLPAGSQLEWSGGDFTVAAVPEPQTWGLLAAGVGLLAWRRRLARGKA